MNMLIVLLLVSLVLALVVMAGGLPSVDASSDFVKATTNQALKSVKSAEVAGADVSLLVERFNVAIDLQHQAESSNYTDCTSADDCIIQSNDMMLAIIEDASELGNQATAKNEQRNIMTFTLYLPLGSFAASVAIVASYRAWKSRRNKRYQMMDIHQRRVH